MEYAQNTIMFVSIFLISGYIGMIGFFTIEHYLTGCVVIIPEYKAKHKAGDYLEALEWIAQYPKGTECQIWNKGKLIGIKK